MSQSQNWKATFFLKIDYKGNIIPSVSFDPPQYQPIVYLFGFSVLYTKKDVLGFIDYITSKADQEPFSYDAEDAAEFIFTGEWVEVKPLIIDFKAFVVSKFDFFSFLNAWAAFLDDYEGAKIPLVIPEKMKHALVIQLKKNLNLFRSPSNDYEAINWKYEATNPVLKRIQASSNYFSHKDFSVFVFEDGNQVPNLNIRDRKFPGLGAFFTAMFPDKIKAQGLFEQLQSFSSDSSLVLELPEQLLAKFSHGEVYVTDHSGNFEPYSLQIQYFTELLEDWITFLDFYERGQIPGLIPTNMMDQLCVVERTP